MIDPDEAAAQAGLLHLGDSRPGIRRRRRGRGFSYHRDRDGRPPGAAAMRRIEALVIPPAWRDVWIAPEADAHLQATGVDAAGRKQYLYHPEWTAATAAGKFDHLATVAACLPKMRRRVADDLAGGEHHGVAIAVRLIDQGLVRPGSAASEAVGATTLEVGHVEIDHGKVVLDFVGKSAVEQHIEVDDPDLAAALRSLLRRSSREDVRLFAASVDSAVDAARVNRYLAEATGESVTAKDLRTWGATAAAVECLCTGKGCDRDPVREMFAEVADRLGNTVAVCRTSYVAPTVIDAYESGELAVLWRSSRRGRWMDRSERALARLLTTGR